MLRLRQLGMCAGLWFATVPALCADALWERLRDGGYVLLMRHAQTVPGTGDPPGYSLDDCTTQRVLSEQGRAQARRVGEAFRQRGVEVHEVRSSAWCRSVDTALLAFGKAPVWSALNSFFDAPDEKESRSAEVRAAMEQVKPPRNWVLVTHQVNITALTGEWAAQGEILMMKPGGGAGRGLQLVGRLTVP